MTPPEEPEDLSTELQWLVHNQAALDARLARVEDSMVFRTLRAIGRIYQTRFARAKAGESRGYAAWLGRAGMDARPVLAPVERPLVSLVLTAGDAGREALARSVESVRAQTYPEWELIVVGPADVWSGATVVGSAAEATAAAAGSGSRNWRERIIYRRRLWSIWLPRAQMRLGWFIATGML